MEGATGFSGSAVGKDTLAARFANQDYQQAMTDMGREKGLIYEMSGVPVTADILAVEERKGKMSPPQQPLYKNAPTTWAAAARRALGPQYPVAPDKEEGEKLEEPEQEAAAAEETAAMDVEMRATKRATDPAGAPAKKQREETEAGFDKMD